MQYTVVASTAKAGNGFQRRIAAVDKARKRESTMNNLGRIIGIVGTVAAVVGLSALPATAQAETYTLKVSHAVTVTHPAHRAMVQFKETVEEKSGGKLEIRIFHSSQLAGQREGVEGLQAGTVEITLTPNGVIAGFDPTFTLMDIPFQFNSMKHARSFIDAQGDDLLLANLDSVGLVGLAVWEQGFRNLGTVESPMQSVEDVKGLRLRTMEAPLHITAWRSLGANPTPIGWAQVYSSLQQGVISGVENPSYIFSQTPIHEVIKHLTLTRHIYDPVVVLGSKVFFDKLPEDLRSLVITTLRDITNEQRKMAEADVEKAETVDLPAMGVQVYEITAESRAKLADMAQGPVLEEIAAKVGADDLKRWQDAVSAMRD
ncbi:TRAP transporter substrate-binding protein [Oceanibacterium hippocampi]|uniref:2,3-diketo-L-gulonate-binding periplasmic protein YiaO n=1 Tax=Oceanibacterium hippocampi TaxID=745714 RepID=A0A1Y5TP00_9PROT|nr:TRAP transporter substrate-binding protein [Oceanibacterium hippocampi]SLN66391.1 2,3-diketo-L-gulonate-binding periplasmic protein YiaO precursor [Oceanibacterium hippocampi]